MGPVAPLWGVLLVVALGVALATGAMPLRRALFPEATRAFAALVVVVVATATFLLAAELTGLVGLLQRGPLALTALALVAAELWIARRLAGRELGPSDAPVMPEAIDHPLVRLATWIPAVVAVGQWVTSSAGDVAHRLPR